MSADPAIGMDGISDPGRTPAADESALGPGVSRRTFLRAGLGGAGVLGAAALSLPRDARSAALLERASALHTAHDAGAHPMPIVVGEVNHERNGFNPTQVLTDFDTGMVTTLPNGQTLREYTFRVENKTIEVVPGVEFAAWTYNGRIPGPTIRVREGDRVRLHLLNTGDHPHSIHFHGVHPGVIDGVFDARSGVVPPGRRHIYEFDAEPFGMHLYHCHTSPLAKHIAKGLYGAFIIDPKAGRPRADHELIMVMSGYDVDFDGANDFYQVNGIPFHYDKHPIRVKVGELVRIYLANTLEYDQSNSFHLHANFFHYYPTGTSLTPAEFTDTVAQMQGQRGILEFRIKHPGRYMFHAHKTEFAELGWTGIFEVES
jgi:FtsP/CotA-like multicopper oxidase with cupredoxin domain